MPTQSHPSMPAASPRTPWVQTPCPQSSSLSLAAGCKIYTKLEHLQPSGSFKSRGIGNLIHQTVLRHRAQNLIEPIHFFSCSAGNAGLAAATASKLFGQQCIVVVPETTSILMQSMIETAGAQVIVHGSCIAESDLLVKSLVAQDLRGAYVSPFDHENIWDGNATVVDELYQQFQGEAPDAIVCSVGGGGLLNGILMGLEKYGWHETTVLAVETEGAESFNQSLRADKVVTMPKMASIAKSLSVSRISDKTWSLVSARNSKAAKHPTLKGAVRSVVLPDAEAAMACVRFLDQEGILVEPACGVSVACAYNNLLSERVPGFGKNSRVVIVVCGGSTVNRLDLEAYENDFASVVAW